MIGKSGSIFCLLLLGLFAFGCSDTVEEVSVPEAEISDLERVDGVLHLRGEKKPFTGLMVEYYVGDGDLKSRSAIVDGRLHGLSEGWHAGGALQVRESFRFGVAHGLRTRWSPDGTIESESEIVDGELHGIFRRWHPNGVLAETTEMIRGEPSGLSVAYFPSGYIRARVLLENGDVVEQQFWEDGEGVKTALHESN